MKASFLKLVLSSFLLIQLISCSSSPDYNDTSPKLKLEAFFSGKVNAYGIVRDYRDTITRRFKVDIQGTWKNGLLTLDEYFLFDDGEKDYRQWRIRKVDDNNYIGQADDIIGDAEGQVSGAYLKWAYQLDLQVDNDTYTVTFDDEMILLDEKHLMNVAKIKKLGLPLGEVIIFFEKQN